MRAFLSSASPRRCSSPYRHKGLKSPRKVPSRPVSPIEFRLLDAERVEVVDLMKINMQQEDQVHAKDDAISLLKCKLTEYESHIESLKDKLAFLTARSSEAEQESSRKIEELTELNSELRSEIETKNAQFADYRSRHEDASREQLDAIKQITGNIKFDFSEILRYVSAQAVICQKRLERADARYKVVLKFIEEREEKILTLRGSMDAAALETRNLKKELLFIAPSAGRIDCCVETQDIEDLKNGGEVEDVPEVRLPTVQEVKRVFNAFTNHEMSSMYSVMTVSIIRLIMESAELIEFIGQPIVTKLEIMRYLQTHWTPEFEMEFKFFLKRFKFMTVPPQRTGSLAMRLFNSDFIHEDDAEDVWMMGLTYFLLIGGEVNAINNEVVYMIDQEIIFRVTSHIL